MAPLRILIADPDDAARAEMVAWIQEEGHHIITTCSGNAAIDLLKTGHFDVVITEVLLPDGDGLDVIKHSRESRLSHRIIAVSGGGSYLTRLDCLKLAKMLGAHGVLLKPLVKHQLLTSIHGAGTTETGHKPAAAGVQKSEQSV